jgi:hypothetical protein
MPDHSTWDRREINLAALGVLLPVPLAPGQPRPAGKIRSIDYQGILLGDCSLPGETRKDDVTPAHSSGLQVSRDRWLLLYATRGFRGVDDDRSIVWQLRKGAIDGPIIKEGMLARSREYEPFGAENQPAGEGKVYVKQHGHPVVFGVPKGAIIDGKPAAHANLFVAKWRAVARILDRKTNALLHSGADPEARRRSQVVEWVQFRLNERDDDLEIVQPAGIMRQQGFEQGPAFCSGQQVGWMNQSFTPPVPFNRIATEWADCNHFDRGRVAALKYRFNVRAGRYDWVETGPMVGDPQCDLSEAILAPVAGKWVIAARPEKGGVAWARADDPFVKISAPLYPKEPGSNAPVTAFNCADGVLRLFTGDVSLSPYKNGRDPLYCWDVDPGRDFACDNRRTIFDTVTAKLAIRPAAVPKVDMCKLLPHQGSRQALVWRVSVRSYNQPYVGSSGKPIGIPAINADEKAACAIHYAQINYREEFPALWQFRG